MRRGGRGMNFYSDPPVARSAPLTDSTATASRSFCQSDSCFLFSSIHGLDRIRITGKQKEKKESDMPFSQLKGIWTSVTLLTITRRRTIRNARKRAKSPPILLIISTDFPIIQNSMFLLLIVLVSCLGELSFMFTHMFMNHRVMHVVCCFCCQLFTSPTPAASFIYQDRVTSFPPIPWSCYSFHPSPGRREKNRHSVWLRRKLLVLSLTCTTF